MNWETAVCNHGNHSVCAMRAKTSRAKRPLVVFGSIELSEMNAKYLKKEKKKDTIIQ